LAGALISATFFENRISPTVFKLNTGVPFEAKKWKPRTGKAPRPGIERGALGMIESVKGWKAAMAGIWLEVAEDSKARGVTS